MNLAQAATIADDLGNMDKLMRQFFEPMPKVAEPIKLPRLMLVTEHFTRPVENVSGWRYEPSFYSYFNPRITKIGEKHLFS